MEEVPQDRLATFMRRFGTSRFGRAATHLHEAQAKIEEVAKFRYGEDRSPTALLKAVADWGEAEAKLFAARDAIARIKEEAAEIKEHGAESRVAAANFRKLVGDAGQEATLAALEKNLRKLNEFHDEVETSHSNELSFAVKGIAGIRRKLQLAHAAAGTK